MIGGPARRLGHDTVEAELTQIDRIHESIDHPNRIVLVDPVVQAFGKQRRLAAVRTCNEAPHPIPRKPLGNHTTESVFTQPGSEPDIRRADGVWERMAANAAAARTGHACHEWWRVDVGLIPSASSIQKRKD